MAWFCSNPWTTLFVWGNGDVTHCCYSNHGPLGNIYKQSPEAIWRGPKLASVRAAMASGDYEKAGCEPFCRVYRWQRFYGHLDSPPSIPEGLGRIKDEGAIPQYETPQVLGYAIDWKCNLRCTHCGGSRNSPGLDETGLAKLSPWLDQAKTLRLMNGEFSINRNCHLQLREIGRQEKQPRIFLNTHGQTPLSKYWIAVGELQSFHLKFSLEGTGATYERIRKGGRWDVFYKNLQEASAIFRSKQAEGRDWKLHLNYCLMHSNVTALPDAVTLAVEMNLPLVINAIHGMRHMRENMFAYSHLKPEASEWKSVVDRCIFIAEENHYPWTSDVKTHLEYIERCLAEPMLGGVAIRWLARRSWSPRRWSGIALYLLLRFKLSKMNGLRYLLRKTRNYFQRRAWMPARLKRRKAESNIPLISES
jgi:hypothetical protein